jgi:hypothetical protein
MSNTSTVTPYDDNGLAGAGDVAGTCGLLAAAAIMGVAAAMAGGVAVARWLAEESSRDRAASKAFREARRRERLAADPPSGGRLSAVQVRIRDQASLLRAARALGYRSAPAATSTGKRRDAHRSTLLVGPAGERLAIIRDRTGGLSIATAGDAQRIQEVVRRHTLDRTLEHLGVWGTDVAQRRLPSGQVEIIARERASAPAAQRAVVTATVAADGSARVDVACTNGSRCDTIVSDFARAVGGGVTDTKRKSEYFVLPGELAKRRLKL